MDTNILNKECKYKESNYSPDDNKENGLVNKNDDNIELKSNVPSELEEVVKLIESTITSISNTEEKKVLWLLDVTVVEIIQDTFCDSLEITSNIV